MSDRRGFTLVELLVSLAILSVALAVLFSAISSSLDRTRKERDDAAATSLVQSLLALGSAGQSPGEGIYPNGYRWALAVTPYGTSDDDKARHVLAFRIRAMVSWRDGDQVRSKSLSALRIVPLPPKQP